MASSLKAEPGSSAGWLPIDSAPKDGTPILLGRTADTDEDGELRDGVAVEGYWMNGYEDGPDCMGHDDCWTDSLFNVFMPPRSFGIEAYRSEGFQPTHWMPLPPPPGAALSAAPSASPVGADTARLDWMEANNGAWCGSSKPEERYMYHGTDWASRRATEATTLRAAIDSAMSRDARHEAAELVRGK